MRFVIPIEPKPQTRPKFSKFGAYEDPKMKAWRKQCSELIEQNYDGPFYDGPIKVDVIFYMKAPKSISKEPSERARDSTWDRFLMYFNEIMWHFKKPDIDNLVKAVFDSISNAGYNKIDKKGIVWSDDNIVCDLRARKLYSPNPRIEIEIEELGEWGKQ